MISDKSLDANKEKEKISNEKKINICCPYEGRYANLYIINTHRTFRFLLCFSCSIVYRGYVL